LSSVIFKDNPGADRVSAMAYFPKASSSVRAPRTAFSTPEPADFRVEDKVIRGQLHRLSTTGGYAALDRRLRGGTLAEIEIPTPLGRIRGLIEFLDRRGASSRPSELAFRFVGLDDTDFERLQSSLKKYG
jgi:hypothetical protein